MNHRSIRLAAIGFACSLYLLTAPAVAWNPSGHMIVALIAYDKLDDATKAKAVELLRAHPRFQDHFERLMPKDVANGSERAKNQWIFAHAATWPDVVRDAKGGVTREDVQNFNRPWWHFVDLPVFLNDAERHELEPTLTVNLSRDVPVDPDDSSMNVIQAIKNSSRIVRDAGLPAEKRSVHLCWLLHLVGDAHQPLHSSALFTTHRFREGDHGGNYLENEHSYKLHGFWDDQISTDEPYSTVRILASDLERNPELAASGERAAALLDAGTWIDESHELAKKYVYTPDVLHKIAAREGHSHLAALNPAPSYQADAEQVSERRAVEAGCRLAKVLEQLLD